MAREHSFSWDAVTVGEILLGDSDLPQETATRTRLTLHTSARVVVELGMDGRYERRSVAPGNFCVTPAGGLIPAARWRGERRIVVVELSPTFVSSVAKSHDVHAFELMSRHADSDPQLSHLMLALREEFQGGNPSGRAYTDMIARAMVVRLLRAHALSAPMRTHRGGLSRRLLQRVTEYIDAHLDQHLGLRSLAAVSGLSEDHFARAFRESTGVPPYRYLLQRRLACAQQLLETSDAPIAEIAHMVGFTDQSHLTKLFRRKIGMTPGRARRHLRWTAQAGRKPTKTAPAFAKTPTGFALTLCTEARTIDERLPIMSSESERGHTSKVVQTRRPDFQP